MLDWIWPSFPTSWAEVPARLRPSATQIARLTVAAVVAYLVADLVSPGILDLTAPLTALLVVQASTVGTLLMGLVRVGAVLTGVLVAVLVTTWTGLSWWSLALVIAVSLLLAKMFRLGDQSLETPDQRDADPRRRAPGGRRRGAARQHPDRHGRRDRLLAASSRSRSRTCRRGRRSAASRDRRPRCSAEVAQTLGTRPPAREELAAWLDWTGQLAQDTAEAQEAVREVEQTRVLNPLALTTDAVHPALRGALDRLERCLAAERALLIVLSRSATGGRAGRRPGRRPSCGGRSRSRSTTPRPACARSATWSAPSTTAPSRTGRLARERTLDAVGEARAVLTELTLLDLDPRQRPDLWMLQGSVLASVDHVLEQLDLERETPMHLLRGDVTEAIATVRPTAVVRFRRRWRRLSAAARADGPSSARPSARARSARRPRSDCSRRVDGYGILADRCARARHAVPSFSGLGRRPLTAVTRVQIPLGSRKAKPPVSRGFCCFSGETRHAVFGSLRGNRMAAFVCIAR